jgi:hypothetical protein
MNPKSMNGKTLESKFAKRHPAPEPVNGHGINGLRAPTAQRERVFMLNPDGDAPAPGYRGIVCIVGDWVHVVDAELPPVLEEGSKEWVRVTDVSIPSSQVEMVEWAS